MHQDNWSSPRGRDASARAHAVLDTVADFRFTAPAKLAADEMREREMARAALNQAANLSAGTGPRRMASFRRRLGAALVAVGTRLQGNDGASLEPQPEA